MIPLYRVVNSTEPTTPSDRATRRPSGERFFLWREMRRYEYGAEKFREAGLIAYADLFENFAEQARLEIAALEEVDTRIAALDAKLAGDAA